MAMNIDAPSLQEEKLQANERDIELMKRVGTGDSEAFQLLVEAHQFAVVGAATKMLGSPTEADDIAQKVFLRVWKAAPRYKPTAQFNTWLYTITRNLVYNETRRRRRKPAVSLEELAEETHQVVPDLHAILPDEHAICSELEEAVDKAIQSLPERQRIAIFLRIRREVSYLEIGRMISASEAAVKQLVFKARTQLRASLQQYFIEFSEG